jgi:sigma-B regulation protein RsbU (phosphoserine phosphatase)
MTLFRSLIRAVSNIDFFTNTDYTGAVTVEKRLLNAISLTNNYFAETHGRTSMFCTIFFGILDPATGILTYVNGGHLPPKLIQKQGVKEILSVTGPAVGTIPGVEFFAKEARLEADDIFFAHTDGLSDVVNLAGEYFNDLELIPLFKGDQPLTALLDSIQERIKDYSSGGKQNDDITMLVVRRKKS